jgi:hypothetical protein
MFFVVVIQSLWSIYRLVTLLNAIFPLFRKQLFGHRKDVIRGEWRKCIMRSPIL